MATFPFNFHCKAGDNLTSAVNVPDGITTYRLEVDVTAWTSSQVVSVAMELSQDNFATVVLGAAMTTTGGVHTDRQGNQALTGVDANMPPGAGWRARGRINVPSPGNLTGDIATAP